MARKRNPSISAMNVPEDVTRDRLACRRSNKGCLLRRCISDGERGAAATAGNVLALLTRALFDYFFEPCEGRAAVVTLAHHLAPERGAARGLFGVVERLANATRQRVGVARLVAPAGLALDDRLAQAADTRGHDRYAASQRFERREA